MKRIWISTVLVVAACFATSCFYVFCWRKLEARRWAQRIIGRIARNPSFERQNVAKIYTITWFNPPKDLQLMAEVLYHGDFNSCEYSNCRMNHDRNKAKRSDAVIFDGRAVQPRDFFQKKYGQVWIFFSMETPAVYYMDGSHFTRGEWVSSFNWTMTYDKSNTDIHIPFGKIVQKEGHIETKNFEQIFRMKNKTALIIHSNCESNSGREKFVKQLGKYIDMDALGNCGKPWNCGLRYRHDDCFKIINNYKFYLAFENAFCDQYFTEKVFRNFNYDSVMVIRGGRNNDTKRMFPSGTYISTEDFNSIEDLAKHLNEIANSEEMYLKLLKEKSRYYSVPYIEVYQRAMCELCERMNKQNVYNKQIHNITEWAYGHKACDIIQH